ncbi:MAG TPA: hypothetical protein VGX75_04905, partial [bacterium]|nr:hypothetical protein [bacterium]
MRPEDLGPGRAAGSAPSTGGPACPWRSAVDAWFARNTFHARTFSDLQALAALKRRQGLTISLGLPALNEELTIGDEIAVLRRALM